MLNFSERLDDILTRYLAYFNYRTYSNEMNLQGNEKVLEVGCGGGNLSRVIAKRLSLGELVCIDSSEYWIEKAKDRLRRFKNIKFRTLDIMNFTEINLFDVIIIHYVLHDISENGKAVAVLRKSLKKDGIIFIREPTRKSHGMSSGEIRKIFRKQNFYEIKSKEGKSFPLRGDVYEGIFKV